MSTDESTPERSGNARGQRRRAELLRAAIDVVLSDGVQDFSVRQVARRAGTSHRIVLYHFGSGENLLREALAAIRADLIAERTADLSDPLAVIMGLVADESDAGRVLVQGVLQAGLDPDRFGPIGQDYVEAYLPLIAGQIPAVVDDSTREDIAALILCVSRGAILDSRSTGESERGQRAVALLLELLRRHYAPLLEQPEAN